MVLAIDIGNTTTTCGLFKGTRLMKRSVFPTHGSRYDLQARRLLRTSSAEAIIVCSVVPRALARLSKALRTYRSARIFILGKNCTVPLVNKYRFPRQVGQDRLVNAYAAVRLHGSPAIVIDYGTAVTFDVISRSGAYLGGMILPGLQLGLDALAQRTALLPQVRIAAPQELIGRQTSASMLSGAVYGMAALTDEMVKKICRAATGRKTRIIATGGNCMLMKRYCATIAVADPDLTLKGLQLLASKFTTPSPR